MRPPNYREGTGRERCGNQPPGSLPCSYYAVAFGKCRMYDVAVQPDHVCDSWVGKRVKISRA